MKILCVGNCQVTPLANIISAARPDFLCKAVEVWKMSQEECEAHTLENYDAIIAQPLVSKRYGALSRENLVQNFRGKPLLFIHNLHFEGTLPDCTYVGPLGNRVNGPMGPYHSSIVLDGFLAGISVAECTARLNEGGGIDPRKAWDTAVETLTWRERAVTVPFVDELVGHMKTQRCFHVFNHPNAFLLERYAEKVLAMLLGQPVHLLDTNQPDLLEPVGTWPIYSWLADVLELPYGRDGYIIPQISKDRISHREFVERSYAAYSETAEGKLVV